MMSIRKLKICGDSIYKPLGLIFRAYLEHGVHICALQLMETFWLVETLSV